MENIDLKKLTKDELIALAEKQASELAEKQEANAVPAETGGSDPEMKTRMMRIRIPRSRGNSAPVYVAVNDYNAMIPRGVEVSVPEYVYLHLTECLDADDAAAMKLEQMQEEFTQRTRSYFG